MKKYFLIAIGVGFLLFIVSVVKPPLSQAQTCGGSVSCCSAINQVCRDGSGNSCRPGQEDCVCTETCQVAQNEGCYCGVFGCSHNAFTETCVAYEGSCTGSCAPPPACPACGNGVCDCGETYATCPADNCPNGGGGAPGCGCCDVSEWGDWDPGVPGNECWDLNGDGALQCCCGNACYRDSKGSCLSNPAICGGGGPNPCLRPANLSATCTWSAGQMIVNWRWGEPSGPGWWWDGYSYRFQYTSDPTFATITGNGLPPRDVLTWPNAGGASTTISLPTRDYWSRVRTETFNSGGGLYINQGCSVPGNWSTTHHLRPSNCTGYVGTCSIDLPASIGVTAGSSAAVLAITAVSGGTISEVRFSTSNPLVATATSPDNSTPYLSTITGVGTGSTTLTAQGIMGGVVVCSDTATVNTTSLPGWWQIIGGNSITNGNVISFIPTTCVAPSCNPQFILNGQGGYPGIPLYAGSGVGIFDFDAGVSDGRDKVSTTNWLANPPYLGASVYNYNYFVNLIPAQVTPSDPGAVAPAASLNAGGSTYAGYRWFRRPGDLVLNPGGLNTNNKIVLFVDGNLTINTNINVNDGRGFFMAIVAGNININPSIGGSAYDLEGLFFTQSSLNTGTSNTQLTVRGSLAALGGINLQRDLGAGNSTNPAEVVEFAPDLFTLYPPFLNKQKTSWREVLP